MSGQLGVEPLAPLCQSQGWLLLLGEGVVAAAAAQAEAADLDVEVVVAAVDAATIVATLTAICLDEVFSR